MSVATVGASGQKAEKLRLENYNARVLDIVRCHDDLMRMRVRPDRGIPHFAAGQYTVLGLGAWETRVEGVQSEVNTPAQNDRLIKRAYSISSSLLDERDVLMRPSALEFLEFYITLVRFSDDGRPPALTPRLFALNEGDRLFCGPHIHGTYTLGRVHRDDNVVFAATGTGEAPHNAMVAELLATGHRGRILSATCVRWKRDLGYLATHRRLEGQYRSYTYLPLTTRELENVDASCADFVGKRYLQSYVSSGDLERDAEFELSPDNTHVFLCGSPEMIGVPNHTYNPARRYPQPVGMVEVLERRGFRVDQPHEPGNVHFEKYW